LNSGLCVCKAGTLLLEPHLHPPFWACASPGFRGLPMDGINLQWKCVSHEVDARQVWCYAVRVYRPLPFLPITSNFLVSRAAASLSHGGWELAVRKKLLEMSWALPQTGSEGQRSWM
jgi:hypothetical protein